MQILFYVQKADNVLCVQWNILQLDGVFFRFAYAMLLFLTSMINTETRFERQKQKRILCQNKTKWKNKPLALNQHCVLLYANSLRRFVWIPRNSQHTHTHCGKPSHRMSQSIKHITVISPFVCINSHFIHRFCRRLFCRSARHFFPPRLMDKLYARAGMHTAQVLSARHLPHKIYNRILERCISLQTAAI